jgi:hypothetical protein
LLERLPARLLRYTWREFERGPSVQESFSRIPSWMVAGLAITELPFFLWSLNAVYHFIGLR